MKPEVGQIYEGKITSITNFGAFVSLPEGPDGMVHISEISDRFIKNINEVCKVGDVVSVKVISIADNGKIALSIKRNTTTFCSTASIWVRHMQCQKQRLATTTGGSS